jgi:hypothetical protein
MRIGRTLLGKEEIRPVLLAKGSEQEREMTAGLSLVGLELRVRT